MHDKRVVDGIERDWITNISPWLKAHNKIPGGPANRADQYIRRLIEMIREEKS